MSVIHTPKKPELDLRLVVFPAVTFSLLGVLFFRLWYFQVVKSQELTERASASREQRVLKPAPRGLVFDRNGSVIAGVRPQIVITGVYKTISKNPGVQEKLAAMLGIDPKKLKQKLLDARRTPEIPVPIYIGADIKTGTRIAEAGDDLPGIGVETAPMRYYPDTTSYTHLLGYVRLPNDADKKKIAEKGRTPAEYVGKAGLEKAYEADLMGEAGAERMEVDAKGHPLRVVGRDNPVPGSQLILSVDSKLQKLASHLMEEKKFIGAVVALDPNNGEILCMVSAPTFNQSLFEAGISKEDYAKLSDDPRHPMINRALVSSYSPGSTFKIVTSLAAQNQGKFDPHSTAYCAGGLYVGKRWVKCLGNHGTISYDRAMQKSCNVYFAEMGRHVGENELRTAALELGLGQRSDFDVNGESRGIVPTAEWFKRHYKRGWYGGDTINFSIGQGDISCTPLQMANLVATVANKGTCYKPHVVKEIRAADGLSESKVITGQVLRKVNAPESFWDAVQNALAGVIDKGGTGQSAMIPGVKWAGKTGSTEHGVKVAGQKEKKTHAWFVGYAPYDNPKIAICVLIEDAGHGGEVAAPIAREVVKAYLDGLNKSVAGKTPTGSPSVSAAVRKP